MQVGLVRLLVLIASALVAVSAGAESTAIISVNAQGQAANGVSNYPAISRDGRFVAFQSSASDLVPGDTNNVIDIFLYDRQTNTLTRVSIGANGEQSNNGSSSPAISQDGRYVAFESRASNLVANDTNNTQDIFVYDRITATTTRVSVGANNVQLIGECVHPAISGDGRFVAFGSVAKLTTDDTNSFSDVFLHDRDPDQNSVFDENNSTTIRISQTASDTALSGTSNFPSISRNGQYVAYSSYDATLVPGDTNVRQDIFVYNIQSQVTERASVSSSGQQSDGSSYFASLSDDGHFVAFVSAATNLASGDTNGKDDVFVRDRIAGATVRASVSNSEAQSASASTNPVISGDGRYVSFASESASLTAKIAGDNAVAPVVFDAITAASGGSSGGAAITYAIYRRDLTQQTTVRVSSNNSGTGAIGSSPALAMSADGMIAAFESIADNLSCTTDANKVTDLFVRDMNTTTAALCGSSSNSSAAKGGGGMLLIWTVLALSIFYVFLRNFPRRLNRQ